MRRISQGLYPPVLESLGLCQSLQNFLRIGELADIGVSFNWDCGSEEARFDREIEIALFRIVQEAVNNAIRHAKASSIEVVIERDGEDISLEIRDNGRGFDPAREAGKGVGLQSMNDRADAVGGELTIESRPGDTSVTAIVPYKEA